VQSPGGHTRGTKVVRLQKLYSEWNATEKQVEVVVVSGDNDPKGFSATFDGAPWVAVPFGEKREEIERHIPCTGYPTPVRPPGPVFLRWSDRPGQPRSGKAKCAARYKSRMLQGVVNAKTGAVISPDVFDSW
jgi:hypothetical protein